MKNIISLVVLMSSIIYSQTNVTKSLIELKQLSAVSVQQSASSTEDQASSIQNQVPSIKLQSPAIPNPLPAKKNPGLAILYSMLLPGMGELYAEGYDSGKYFTIADGVLWGAFAGFDIYARNQENNYKSFAQSNAGAGINGKDAAYFANIGIYLSVDAYNKEMELNRNFEETYNPATHHWNWTSDARRKEYRNIWTSSESAYTNVRFVVGALVLNRVISAINAVRLVSAYNRNISNELTWNIYIGLENRSTLPQAISLNFISRL